MSALLPAATGELRLKWICPSCEGVGRTSPCETGHLTLDGGAPPEWGGKYAPELRVLVVPLGIVGHPDAADPDPLTQLARHHAVLLAEHRTLKLDAAGLRQEVIALNQTVAGLKAELARLETDCG